MITQHNYDLAGDTTYQGESTDTKPTEGVPVNALFLELDTKTIYYFNGTSWSVYGGE